MVNSPEGFDFVCLFVRNLSNQKPSSTESWSISIVCCRFAPNSNVLKEAFKSGFVKNLSVLVTGTAIAQAIPVLLQPILRRVFDADMFALFAVYNSITSILIVVTTLRYDLTIVLPKEDRDGINITFLSLLINTLFALAFFAIIALFPESVTRWISWPVHHKQWLWLIPPAVFLFSAGQTLNYWLIRKKGFRASATNRIGRRIAEGVIQTAGGVGQHQRALIWGELAGRAVYLSLAWKQSLRVGLDLREVSRASIRAVARRYKEFPLYQTFPALLNAMSLMMPVLLVNAYYSAETTAQFDLGRQLMVLPLALITTAMSQVLLQKFTEQKQNQQPLLQGFLRISAVNTLFAVLVTLVIVLAGAPLFGFLFGKPWETAGVYAAVLAPAFMSQFVVSPVSTLIITLEKVKLGAVWQILCFLGILSLWFFRHLTELQFFKVFTIINVVMYALYWILLWVLTLRHDKALKGA